MGVQALVSKFSGLPADAVQVQDAL